ncbi:MAG: hypothetical protein NTU43_00220 [Bacteroidetes bacterium]|nr:hypothetical protein [Bacteroidota bacterium]
MKLDFIKNINEYGDRIVRLYDFDMKEAQEFSTSITNHIIRDKSDFRLTSANYIQTQNCQLSLCLSEEDEGITHLNQQEFICKLTLASYRKMLLLIEPFCKKEMKSYQWLYEDIDNPIDFLFSPSGK